MRLHEHFPQLWPNYDDSFVDRLLRVENLVAVRMEPVYSMRFEAFMDALFECNTEWLIVPMLRVDGVSIMVPENPPVTWPSIYSTYKGERIDRIDAEIVPWLRAITAGRLVNDEHVRFFREEPRLINAYHEARARRLIGATPYPDVLKTAAQAVYALRFSKQRRVALCGDDAANGSAIVSSVAETIDANIGDFERRWFAGLAIGNVDVSGRYDCYVGPRSEGVRADYAVYDGDALDDERLIRLAEPIPTDVTLSFDVEDAPESRRLAVSEVALSLAEPVISPLPVTGGSAGRIRLIIRENGRRFSDADIDAADTLAELLRAEGFDAQVTIAAHVDSTKVDLIHVFDLRHGVSVVELLRDAEAARVPVIVTPYADDRKNEATSGASGALLIPRVSSDTITFYDFVTAFAARKVSNLSEGAWYDEVAHIIMRRAAAAIVAAPEEAQFVHERFGYTGATVPCAATVPTTRATPRIGSLVGPDEFVLLHAPIEPRANHVYAALAAQRLGLPLVLLGPVADIEYYRYLNEVAGPSTIQLREEDLQPDEVAGLYARARVVADVSWSSRGLHRLARGAAHGAAIVAPAAGYAADVWQGLVACADPASLDSITQALHTAWTREPQHRVALAAATAATCSAQGSLVAAVSAYQHAGGQAVR